MPETKKKYKNTSDDRRLTGYPREVVFNMFQAERKIKGMGEGELLKDILEQHYYKHMTDSQRIQLQTYFAKNTANGKD